MSKTSDNHTNAPQSAEFVKRMRDVFGIDQVTVLYVKENGVQLGEQTHEEMATCFHADIKKKRAA